VTATDRRSSQLDRRRDQASAAADAAQQARAAADQLKARLETNATLERQHSKALGNASAEVTRLKRALKAVGEERKRLSKEHDKAGAKAKKAAAKSEDAEARYEKTVLADLVRREKQRDRSQSAQPKALAPVPDSAPAAVNDDPAPEQPEKATATTTAARKTAAKAQSAS
jgi:chromosome segregation ATPase